MSRKRPTEDIRVIAKRLQMPMANDCEGCSSCVSSCPSNAIDISDDWTIDIGKCVFCMECLGSCVNEHISLIDVPEYFTERSGMTFISGTDHHRQPGKADENVRKVLGRSISIREVDTGSCNACEVEINSLSNQFYDFERFGIKIAASPRHADMLLITGPLTKNMETAMHRAIDATPDPKIVVAMGTCAISGGMFRKGSVVGDGIDDNVKVDIYVPGCPPSPDMIIRAITSFIGRL